MGSFLKPNKANLAGTAALLAGNFIFGYASRFAMQLVNAGSAPDTASFAGRTAGSFAGTAGGYANSGVRMAGASGLIGGAVSTILLALVFYVIVSFVIDMHYKENNGPGAEETKKENLKK